MLFFPQHRHKSVGGDKWGRMSHQEEEEEEAVRARGTRGMGIAVCRVAIMGVRIARLLPLPLDLEDHHLAPYH